ncbi:MAG: divergent polysaccharide deacetylase family protein [Chitinispirillaceae bacterium]
MKSKTGPVLIIGLLLLLTGLMLYPKTRELLLTGLSTPGSGEKTARSRTENTLSSSSPLEKKLIGKFLELELYDTDYSISNRDSVLEMKVSVPKGKPLEWIVWNFSNATSGSAYTVEDCFCHKPNRCTIRFKSSNSRQPPVVLKIDRSNRYFSNTAEMAILLEDFGFEADRTTIEYLSFPEPLTVSLVPSQRLASWTAKIADEYKKEIVVLLPMESVPSEYDKYRNSTLMIHFPEDKIRSLLNQSIAAIPNFSGMCNFYGARAMEDSRVMEIVLSEVKKNNSYFVYSKVTRKSVARSVARRLKVPYHPVQGTIELDDSPEKIREKLKKYSIAAQKTGRILIKSPPSPEFIDVLKMQLDELRYNGIRLVYVSDLIRDYRE